MEANENKNNFIVFTVNYFSFFFFLVSFKILFHVYLFPNPAANSNVTNEKDLQHFSIQLPRKVFVEIEREKKNKKKTKFIMMNGKNIKI